MSSTGSVPGACSGGTEATRCVGSGGVWPACLTSWSRAGTGHRAGSGGRVQAALLGMCPGQAGHRGCSLRSTSPPRSCMRASSSPAELVVVHCFLWKHTCKILPWSPSPVPQPVQCLSLWDVPPDSSCLAAPAETPLPPPSWAWEAGPTSTPPRSPLEAGPSRER